MGKGDSRTLPVGQRIDICIHEGTVKVKIDFSRRQWRIFAGCFLSYFSAYLTRLNLSAAMNNLMTDMALTAAQSGLLQTVFALVYACGQLVNGAIVDRVSARRHILLGLCFTGLFNLLFGLATQYWMLVAIWALNGAAQSMIWTPEVKLMSVWFKGRRRSQVSFCITLTLIAGNLSAWVLSGTVASALSWRWSFIIPAVWAVFAGVASWSILRDYPQAGEDLGDDEAAVGDAPAGPKMPFRVTLLFTGLAEILICCVCNGFVRDGIITWAPTIIANLKGVGGLNPTMMSLVIPLLNLVGVLAARKVYAAFNRSARRCVGYLMLLSGLLALLLMPLGSTVYTCVLLLGLCCSATYGISPMLTTFIPMEYERAGRVGLVAGMMDSFIYIGSALAGVVTGAVSDSFGWRTVFALWSAAAVLACAAGLMSVSGARRLYAWKGQQQA